MSQIDSKAKAIFYMMVGLPGSGKSTIAEDLAKRNNANIHSSDAIREELSGDIDNQNINDVVFETLHNRVKSDLSNGKNCIYDATNISYKRRRFFLNTLKDIPCIKICVIAATPYSKCLINNENRDRQVPVNKIKEMYKNFDMPYYYEGWDSIRVMYFPKSKWSSLMPIVWVRYPYIKEFNQENSHHNLTLGEHCEAVGRYINEKCPGETGHDAVMRLAAAIHDCGKPFTKEFYDAKGRKTSDAHYFNHHKTGAYDALFFTYKEDPLEVAIRVYWHMQPYFNKTEKLKNKYRNLWGEELYNDIMLLHEADRYAR